MNMRGDADMRGRIARKIKSRAGESIAETLIGLLVASLALVMLAGAISTASRLIAESKRKMGEYYIADAYLATHKEEYKSIIGEEKIKQESMKSITLKTVDDSVNSVNQKIEPVDGESSITCYTNSVFTGTPVHSYSYSYVKTSGEG